MPAKALPKIALIALAFFALFRPPTARAADPAPEDTPAEEKPAEEKPAGEKPALDEAGVEDTSEEPAEGEGEDDDSITRGLSWDVLGGGVPDAGSIGQLEIGFSGLPRVSYHYTLSPGFSVGGMASFDYAYWAPRIAFAPSILLQAPVRYSLIHDDSISFGVRADPGIGLFLKGPKTPSFTLGLLLNVSTSIGFTLQNRMIVGLGVDVPMVLGVSGDGAFFRFPLLIGPIFEFHATPPLAMTFDFKIGPHLTTSADTIFAFRLMAGVAYRL